MPDQSVTLCGNVTRDPDLRYTSGGQAFAKFGLAVNRRWQNRTTQEWEEEVSFFDVTCWRDLAENVSESISKGARVVVFGRLQQRSWTNDNGDKRSAVEVVADDVGASMRWASVAVTRNDRRSRVGNGGPAPARAAAPGGYDDLGEEPF